MGAWRLVMPALTTVGGVQSSQELVAAAPWGEREAGDHGWKCH